MIEHLLNFVSMKFVFSCGHLDFHSRVGICTWQGQLNQAYMAFEAGCAHTYHMVWPPKDAHLLILYYIYMWAVQAS